MNKQDIDTICWWIPFRKLRDAVRAILSDFANISSLDIYKYNSLEFNKRFIYESKKSNKPSMLILVKLLSVGGIEERVYKMLKIYKKYYNVFIFSDMRYFDFHKIIEDKELFVYLTDAYSNRTAFEKFLKKILIYHNISLLEIHYSDIFDISIDNLKSNNLKIVAHLHSSLDTYGNGLEMIMREINKFDMVVKVKDDIDIVHNNVYTLRNGIENISDIYNGKNSNRCIIISRLDKDKLNSLYTLIEFALSNDLLIDIAGNGEAFDFVKKNILENFKDNIKNINFIGYINTVEYLLKNSDKYIFVSGMGQIVLEATSLGFPCLISDRKENIVTFVTRDNWLELYKLNFSNLTILNDKLKNTNLKEIINNSKYYNITDLMSECLIENITNEYLEVISKI